jgi:hypothetical protein
MLPRRAAVGGNGTAVDCPGRLAAKSTLIVDMSMTTESHDATILETNRFP